MTIDISFCDMMLAFFCFLCDVAGSAGFALVCGYCSRDQYVHVLAPI
jgi:hypothetical protein